MNILNKEWWKENGLQLFIGLILAIIIVGGTWFFNFQNDPEELCYKSWEWRKQYSNCDEGVYIPKPATYPSWCMKFEKGQVIYNEEECMRAFVCWEGEYNRCENICGEDYIENKDEHAFCGFENDIIYCENEKCDGDGRIQTDEFGYIISVCEIGTNMENTTQCRYVKQGCICDKCVNLNKTIEVGRIGE